MIDGELKIVDKIIKKLFLNLLKVDLISEKKELIIMFLIIMIILIHLLKLK